MSIFGMMKFSRYFWPSTRFIQLNCIPILTYFFILYQNRWAIKSQNIHIPSVINPINIVRLVVYCSWLLLKENATDSNIWMKRLDTNKVSPTTRDLFHLRVRLSAIAPGLYLKTIIATNETNPTWKKVAPSESKIYGDWIIKNPNDITSNIRTDKKINGENNEMFGHIINDNPFGLILLPSAEKNSFRAV